MDHDELVNDDEVWGLTSYPAEKYGGTENVVIAVQPEIIFVYNTLFLLYNYHIKESWVTRPVRNKLHDRRPSCPSTEEEQLTVKDQIRTHSGRGCTPFPEMSVRRTIQANNKRTL